MGAFWQVHSSDHCVESSSTATQRLEKWAFQNFQKDCSGRGSDQLIMNFNDFFGKASLSSQLLVIVNYVQLVLRFCVLSLPLERTGAMHLKVGRNF